jgi:hypothetical protein
MDDSLSREGKKEIQALCDEIAVAHDLDEELREELRGHIEDKVLGYLSGDEVVSEADAVILAREHFGDRVLLRSLLSEIHGFEAAASTYRRIAAAAVATLGIVYVTSVAEAACAWALGGPITRALSPDKPVTWGFLPQFVAGLVALVFLWRILARMKSRLERVPSPWFVRWSALKLIGLVVIVLAVGPIGRLAATLLWHGSSVQYAPPTGNFWLAYVAGTARPAVSAFGVLVLWLWWCDAPPRRGIALVRAALCWAALSWIEMLLLNQFGVLPRELLAHEPPRTVVLMQLGELVWTWRQLLPPIAFVTIFGKYLIRLAVIALVVLCLYEGVRWVGVGRRPQAQSR